ncbi:restriction modification system S chain-like protein [Hymenobacter qilianensis]|uniref:Restriction modification system S chain-like protein n=2 Tax=Hymenobacter qilianensis TaxID=1385715 RepID=A0ACB5PR80_9BACT|nr:restriction endonuclease subunit S [Hymenobacter qilianensis]QNP52067.1 restriction endonuclease subunit S [Hymenobacter qilianensis]GGF64262.1 restriction modification system S chain-like protein [Hymenobacter qilianensis]
MDATQVPTGYKLTELGIIPQEWEAKTFGEVMTGFSSGATPYRAHKHYYDGKINWVTSGELNYNVITHTIEHISKEAQKRTNLKLLPKGTFLMAITGLEAAGTRGSCAILGTEATTNQSCLALFPIKDLLTTQYLFYYYVLYGDALAFQFCQGTKQQSYTGSIVKRLPIILPPLAEQQAIAAALGEMDALLAAQRARLAKQRAVKQGLLQGLLSRKQRLRGFSEEWKVKRLGDIADITKLAGYEYTKYFNSYRDEGEIIVIRGTNITHNKLDLSDIKTIPKATSKFLKRSQLNIGDMVFAYVGTIGPVYLIEENNRFHLGPNTAKITARHELEPKFLFHYFTSELGINEMQEHISIGAQPSLSMTKIRLFNINTPSLKEQRAIADVLSEADAYLAALEAEHAKTQLLKQGMMQNLLTGKLRLV